ncbi:MAG: hypothetical protein FDX12_05530 [Chlorobium sp.]|jgi:hypothetical protein|nr:MAG: hypothetical protein FDX12_05530 [Chlorobium sp.]
MKSSNDFQAEERSKPSFWKRFLFITITLLIASLAGSIFIMRYLQEQKRQQFAAKIATQYVEIQQQDIRLFSLALAWSVRKELMRFNYDQVDEYFNELIKRKGFVVIMLVDPSGNIRLSTDRKLQGGSFSRFYPGINLGTSELESYPLQKGKSMFVVPVMGLNDKLGTISFIYSYQELSLP